MPLFRTGSIVYPCFLSRFSIPLQVLFHNVTILPVRLIYFRLLYLLVRMLQPYIECKA